jgi:hypothetical protein
MRVVQRIQRILADLKTNKNNTTDQVHVYDALNSIGPVVDVDGISIGVAAVRWLA